MKRNRMSVKRVRHSKRKNARHLTIKRRNKIVKSFKMRGGAELYIKPYSPGNGGSGVEGVNEMNAGQNAANTQVGGKRSRGKRSRGKRSRTGVWGLAPRGKRSRSKRSRSNKKGTFDRVPKQRGGSAWLDKLYAYAPPLGMMGPVPQPSYSADANKLIINAAKIHVAGQSNAEYDGNVCPVK